MASQHCGREQLHGKCCRLKEWKTIKREAVVRISADETIPGSKMRISSGSSLRSQHRQHFLGGRGCLMELVVPGAPSSHWNMEPGEELSWGKDDSPCSYGARGLLIPGSGSTGSSVGHLRILSSLSHWQSFLLVLGTFLSGLSNLF